MLMRFNHVFGFENFHLIRRKSDKKLNFWHFEEDIDQVTFGHWDKAFITHFLTASNIKLVEDATVPVCAPAGHKHGVLPVVTPPAPATKVVGEAVDETKDETKRDINDEENLFGDCNQAAPVTTNLLRTVT